MTTQPAETAARPSPTLSEIATAAAELIADARAASLTPPCALSGHDYYGGPAASLFVSDIDTPDIWGALKQWADRYGAQITTRPGSTPGTRYASVKFTRDAISFEVYSIIRNAPGDEIRPAQDQAA
jgi:hypothetical protein